MTDAEIKAELSRLAAVVKQANADAKALLSPGLAVFVTDFNGQQFGKSRTTLRGHKVMVESVFLHSDGTYNFHAWRTEEGRSIDAGFYARDIKFLEV
jgi:hypothetical protein